MSPLLIDDEIVHEPAMIDYGPFDFVLVLAHQSHGAVSRDVETRFIWMRIDISTVL